MGQGNKLDLKALKASLANSLPDTGFSRISRRKAAVAIVLRQSEAGLLDVLLIQRADDPRDPWSGHMAFPGGRCEPADSSLEAAARRETEEEVGLELGKKMLLGRLDDICAGRFQDLSVSPFVYFHPRPGELFTSPEVARAIWVSLDYLLNRDNVCAYSPPPPSDHPVYPSVEINGCSVWGLTYRMLCSLATVIGQGMVGEDEFRLSYKISPGS